MAMVQQLPEPADVLLGKLPGPAWLWAILAGVLLPVISHLLLPAIGLSLLATRLTPQVVCSMGFLILGAVAYAAYFKWVVQRPIYLVIYSLVCLRFVIFLVELIEATGRHIPFRMIHIPILVIPAVYILLTNFKGLSKWYRYFNYMAVFIGVYILFYLFYNHNFVDPSVAKFANVSVSKGQVIDYIYGFVSLILTGGMFLKTKTVEERRALFTLVNTLLIVETLIESGLAILGYPLGLFTLKVEGFRRSIGFLTHPNEFGKSLGLLLIYFIGLYYYYIKQPAVILQTASSGFQNFRSSFLSPENVMKILLPLAIVTSLLAFLLTLSKNSFLAFGVAALLYLASALFDSSLRRRMVIPLVALGCLIIIALVGYQAFSGKSIIALITERFNDTRSLEWRTQVWGYLLSHVDSKNAFFGHGLTASNMEMYRFQYKADMASEKQSIYVHNAFIQYIFDMGVCGLMIFTPLLSAFFTGCRQFIATRFNPLFLAVIGLSLFVLIGALVDECITEMQMNVMYWCMITMIFSFLYGAPTPITHNTASESGDV